MDTAFHFYFLNIVLETGNNSWTPFLKFFCDAWCLCYLFFHKKRGGKLLFQRVIESTMEKDIFKVKNLLLYCLCGFAETKLLRYTAKWKQFSICLDIFCVWIWSFLYIFFNKNFWRLSTPRQHIYTEIYYVCVLSYII